jgi:hypothetical protein
MRLQRDSVAILRVTFVCSLLFLLLSASVDAQSPSQQAYSWARMKKTPSGMVFITDNATFQFVHLLNGDGEEYSDRLLEIHAHNEQTEGREGVTGRVTVIARSGKKVGPQIIWRLRGEGNEGFARDEDALFGIATYPCCASPMQRQYFSLWSGAKLYTTSTVYSELYVDPNLKRIYAQYGKGRYSAERFVAIGEANLSKEGLFLQYGSNMKIMDRIRIDGFEMNTASDLPTLRLIAATSTNSGDLRLTGGFDFLISLDFGDGKEIRIPVQNDHLVAEKATVPNGLQLHDGATRN